jgi:hypothetical protein
MGLRNLAKAGSESVTLRGGLIERIYQESSLRSEAGTVGKDVGKATVEDIAPKGRVYSAIEPGPLPSSIAEAFSGGRYTERVLEKEAIFYRVHGGKAGVIGRRGTFVSPEPQVGGLQSLIDLGLRPEWGNTAAKVSKIKVPAGTRVYEGIVSSQGGPWVGGKVQVFIPKISPEWVVP